MSVPQPTVDLVVGGEFEVPEKNIFTSGPIARISTRLAWIGGHSFWPGDIPCHQKLDVLEGGLSLVELDAEVLFDDLRIPVDISRRAHAIDMIGVVILTAKPAGLLKSWRRMSLPSPKDPTVDFHVSCTLRWRPQIQCGRCNPWRAQRISSHEFIRGRQGDSVGVGDMNDAPGDVSNETGDDEE